MQTVADLTDSPEAGGHERLRIDGIWCIPGQEFLQRLVPSRGLIEWLHG